MTLKERIIAASLKQFAVNGFMNTSISDVIDAAGTSKGGLYNHFKSKDDLFFAAIGEVRTYWRDRNLYRLDAAADPIEKIIQLFWNYRYRYLTDETLPGGCFFVNLALELNDQRPDLAETLNDGLSRLKGMIKRYLEEAVAENLLSPSTDTQAVTDMLFCGLIGASVMYTSDKSEENLGAALSALTGYLIQLKTS